MSLLPAELAGQNSSILIADGINYGTTKYFVDWESKGSRSQSIYPRHELNLPIGTVIKALVFEYHNDDVDLDPNRPLSISLGECSSVPDYKEEMYGFIDYGLSLVYEGPHGLQKQAERTPIRYELEKGYVYKGGCLVIDIQSEGEPKSGDGNVFITSTSMNCITTLSGSSDQSYVYAQPGGPMLTLEFKPQTSPILYIPFESRTINLGSLVIGERMRYDIPVSNKGGSALRIESVSHSIANSIGATVEGGKEGVLPVTISVPTMEYGSFKDTVAISSNGGNSMLILTGTTYQVGKASTVVDIRNGDDLENCSPDISELSVIGSLSYSDWLYICQNFKNLRYLDLSGAISESDRFPASAGNPMACASRLERLCLPMNTKSLNAIRLADLGLVMLRDIVLPPTLEEVSGSASAFSYCQLLENLIVLAPKPFYMDGEILARFKNIYVPENVIESYRMEYPWSQMHLSEITPEVLSGNVRTDFSLEFAGDGQDFNYGLILDRNKEVSQTQVYYPADVLGIPKGTLIKSVRLTYRIWDEQAQNGTMRIFCAGGEAYGPNIDRFITDGTLCYDGSDNLSCLQQEQAVTYKFEHPYEYKGDGLIMYFESRRSPDYATDVFVAVNEERDIQCWTAWSEGDFIVSSQKLDLTLNIESVSEEPYLFIPFKGRELNCGYARTGEESFSTLVLQNLGGRDLDVHGLFSDGNNSFMLSENVIIPAYSSQLARVVFRPSYYGSVIETGRLESNGGLVQVKLLGTSLRQAPYEQCVENIVMEPGRSLRELLNDKLGYGNWEQVTELSVTGALSEDDVWILHELPNLCRLDLSTATVASERYFWDCLSKISWQFEQLALPLNVKGVNFYDMGDSKLTKLVLPVNIQSIGSSLPENLTSLIILAPEPPRCDYYEALRYVNTVYVPEDAIAAYKGSSWYRDDIELLPVTEEILSADWTGALLRIREDVVYDELDYPGGKQDILIQPALEESRQTVSLWNKAPLAAKSLTLENHLYLRDAWNEDDLFYEESSYASFINENDQMTAESVGYALNVGARNWHYLSFPFDFSLEDMKSESFGQTGDFVLRFYDGAARAANGLDRQENWKDVLPGNVLKAGQGYIFQSDWGNERFSLSVSDVDAIRSFVFTGVKTIPLEEHPVTDPERIDDMNWNFIGNPYPSFFNIRYIEEYTAPILIWNGSGYVALSARDDNYALRPLEAFFTQKPEGVKEMRFNPQGRLISPMIENPVDLKAAAVSSRQVINLRLVGEKYTDLSRVVINPEAKESYELACDAAKWMSPNTSLPQFYTMDDAGHRYAINERPQASGIVPLGIYIGEAGEYTLKIPEEERRQTILVYDKLRDKGVDLSKEAYTFSADKGTFDDRFELRISSVVTSSDLIQEEEVSIYTHGRSVHVKAPVNSQISVYSIAGIRLVSEKMMRDTWSKSFPSGIYVIRVGDKSRKLIIY